MYIFFIPNFHITSKLIEKKNLTLFENAIIENTNHAIIFRSLERSFVVFANLAKSRITN